MKSIFESLYNNYMSTLLLEEEHGLAPADANEIKNSFGRGYDYKAGRNLFDFSQPPLNRDYSKMAGIRKSANILTLPLYCKPEVDASKGMTSVNTLGKTVVYWLQNFDRLAEKLDLYSDMDRMAQMAIPERHFQAFGLMYSAMFLYDDYEPNPTKYSYYRVDIPLLNAKVFDGKIMDAIKEDPKEVAKKIDQLDASTTYDDGTIIYKYDNKNIIRKSDRTYSAKKVTALDKSVTLSKDLCLTKEQYDKLSNLLQNDVQSVINQCKAHMDGTRIHSSHPYFDNPAAYAARVFKNEDKPFAVGTNNDFEIHDGYVNCIKISDLLDGRRDTSNPDYVPKRHSEIAGLFRTSSSGKQYMWVYLWDDEHECAVAKKIPNINILNRI